MAEVTGARGTENVPEFMRGNGLLKATRRRRRRRMRKPRIAKPRKVKGFIPGMGRFNQHGEYR